MYSFEKTNDPALIKSVMAHPACYAALHDDFAPAREDWEPAIHSAIHYYAVRNNRDLIGMFMCSQHSAIEIEVHTAFLPKAWGNDARPAACEFLRWIWEKTPIERIIGKIAASNVASLDYAESLGFKVFGVDERSKMYGGRLCDQIYFGMSRP